MEVCRTHSKKSSVLAMSAEMTRDLPLHPPASHTQAISGNPEEEIQEVEVWETWTRQQVRCVQSTSWDILLTWKWLRIANEKCADAPSCISHTSRFSAHQ
ncbi:hypothetical protein TNCV_785191 [Trichonephila clavipes]|nr:hypothetical protein TNCV_785191 [Trichonephila clavipes]